MSLRNEIEKHIHFRFYEGNAIPYADRVTNEILSKIEKRIDSISKEYQKNDRVMIGFDELKKEMLLK